LNLEAVDKIDPKQRTSPPSRELFAQGVGNLSLGLIGGIPATSVIVRSSVNINAGAQTKLSAIFHGVFLLVCVMFLPTYLNLIPLSTLAAVLIVTGVKLASPALIARMWRQGRYQFVPFAATLVSIVLTDILIGVLIGLAVSSAFILYSNVRRPPRQIVEHHLGGDVLHIELANQVSFLNRAALERILREAPEGSHVLLDATETDYVDPDVLDLIRDFKDVIAPAHSVQVSLTGFRDQHWLVDVIQYADYSTRELQEKTTPAQVLQLLRDGNERFRTGRRLSRDFGRQLNATARGQHPLAVVLSCVDSRAPAEIVFDLGLGDIFSVRIAGNVPSPKVLGSMEYGCAFVGAKLVVVMGHTQCGAVAAAVRFACSTQDPEQATGCQHLLPIVREIQESMESVPCDRIEQMSDEERAEFVDGVAERNVLRTVQYILRESRTFQKLVDENRVAVMGAMYDVATGKVHFLTDRAVGLREPAEAAAV
jgi:carbonic anhydrase/SulP family sulfate permease